MKKLLILNTDPMEYSYGGVCQFKKNMDLYLQEAFDVEYLVLPLSAFYKSENERFSMSARLVAMLPGPRRLKYLLYLFVNFRKISRVDFILSHGPEGSFVASFTNVPFAHVYHGNSNPMTISRFWFGNYFARLYDKISERIDMTCPLVYTVGPARKPNQKKINNPLNQNVAPIPIKDRSGFVFAGRLESMKNVDRLIRIYSKLPDYIKKDNPFFIIGYGTQESPLKELVEEINDDIAPGKVVFLGKVDTSLMLETDATKKILIMASSTEGMPTAIAEAFTVGLPVVSTAVGDIPSVVKDGVNGKLLPLDFEDCDYVDAIVRIFNDYESYAKNAEKSSIAFNRERITNKVIGDIFNIIGKNETTL